MRGSIKWQVKEIWKQLDGIGQSKAQARAVAQVKNLSETQIKSDKIHSFKYKDEVLRTARELGEFAKERFGIKDMQAISSEVVREYIQQKISNGLTYRSISTYIGHLDKIRIGLEKMEAKLPEHQNLFTREDLKELRDVAKESAKPNEHIPREYVNPQKIISNLKTEEAKIVANLQLQEGLRVKEALLIKENQLQGNTLTFQGKGGYTLTKELSPQLANQIQNYIQEKGEFKMSYHSYYSELKQAVEKSGEKWSGTHGFRYNYAQSRMDYYQKEQGYSYQEALKLASVDMGHNRPEITEYYL